MTILQINKFFYPKGGAETYFFNLIDLLKKHGQKVLVFSQKNPKNLASAEAKYFLTDLDLSHFNWPMILKSGRLFFSPTARQKISRLIEDKKPDLVHLHNIYHQISPSILPVIKKFKLPIVMTVHDFKLIKADYTLPAAKIKSAKPWPTKLLLNLEFAYHRLLKTYQKNIDLFIAPSQFVKKQLIAHGFNPKKIAVVPHFLDLKKYQPGQTNQNYLLYFGRLDESKGLNWLLKSFAEIKNKKIKLKIVGAGPAEKDLKKLKAELKLGERVEFLGFKNKTELIKLIQNSLAVVAPSLVKETFGLNILESFACAKPVIAAKVGAYPELVKNQKTGILVDIGQKQLTAAIDYLAANPQKARIMGKNARQVAEKYGPEDHYQKIKAIYQKLLA